MLRKSLTLCAISSMLLLISCNNATTTAKTTGKTDVTKQGHTSSNQNKVNTKDATVFHKELKSGRLHFIVDCDNQSTKSKLTIAINGLENTNYKETFDIDAIVEDAIIVDLDKNNYMELYVLLAKNDGSGNKDLKAFSSYRNKSAGEIFHQVSRMKKQPNSDKFSFDGEMLRRTFIDGKGDKLEITHVLVAGEAGYRLIPNMRVVK